MSVIDRIIRETAPVFGLPPYWWRAVDGNCSYVTRRPSKALYNIPDHFDFTTPEERADCFAVIVGKAQRLFQGRDEILRGTGVGSGTYAVASLRWQAMKELHPFYCSLGGELGNIARKEMLEEWKNNRNSIGISTKRLKGSKSALVRKTRKRSSRSSPK